MKAKNKSLLPFILVFSALAFLFIGDVFAQDYNTIGGKRIKEGIWNGGKIEYVEGQILVKLKPESIMETVEPLIPEDKRIARDCEIHKWGLMEIDESVVDIFEEMELLKRNPAVEAVEPNMVGYAAFLPNDPFLVDSLQQWALYHPDDAPAGGDTAAHIHIIDGWDVYRQKQGDSSRVVLAVLDTGIPLEWENNSLTLCHPDLNDPNRFILGIDCTGDGEGVTDSSGHGTHVTGIAAAEISNDTGIAGVFMGPVLVEQVMDRNTAATVGGFCTACYDALFYAYWEGKRLVINFSGGWRDYSQSLEAMIHDLLHSDIVLVAAVGNNRSDDYVLYPAKFSSYGTPPYGHQNGYENVVAVGASNHLDERAGYSNYNKDSLHVDVVAPGGAGEAQSGGFYKYNDIVSTTPPYDFDEYIEPGTPPGHPNTDYYYGFMAGTSMAAPHVSGLASLILSVNNTLSAGEVRDIIKNSADSLSGESEYEIGAGRINAHQALLDTPGLQKPLTQYEPSIRPAGFQLFNNYPNPFNPETEVGYHLPEDCHIEISVYNTLGQKVAELVNGRKKAGSYAVRWDGRSKAGGYAASGLYFYKLRAKGKEQKEGFTQIRKMLLLR